MSKLVSWGHWVVAALFAIQGIPMPTPTAIRNFVHGLRDGSMVMYPIYFVAIWCAASLMCSWGLAKWRDWGRASAIILTILEIVLGPVGLLAIDKKAFDLPIILSSLLLCATLVWLLLPAVRAEFVRRNQMA